MDRKIVIVGAGPTGLGTAYRLKELGYKNFQIIEKENYVGGLSASFKDKKGFIWDIGGHVIHSHFPFFNKVLKDNLKNQKYTYNRQSYVYFKGKLIPYPFQNHIHNLPPQIFLECFWGVIKSPKSKNTNNFLNFINQSMGKGIAKHFMIPYNQKVWGYPLSKMSTSWISERVSTISPTSILKNIFTENAKNWGPNSRFIYPQRGIGSLWKAIAKKIGAKSIYLNSNVKAVDTLHRIVTLEHGKGIKYDLLISTIPITELIKIVSVKPKNVENSSKKLVNNTAFFYGIGIIKKQKTNASWIYYPQKDISFYRATFLSNYSKYLTPKNSFSSILVEISSKQEPSSQTVIDDLVKAKIIKKSEIPNIVDIWKAKAPYAYPIPTLNRDQYLKIIQKYLISKSIFSRGRFGAWKYEVSNMDYSFMQGVEIVDKILLSKPETIWHL